MEKTTLPLTADQAQSAAVEQIPEYSDGYIKHYQPECLDLVSFTLFTKDNGNLTKTISLDDSGTVRKDSSDCCMANGTAETITMSFAELQTFFGTIKQNQAIGGGVCRQKVTGICSMKQMGASSSAGCITRTKGNFFYANDQQGLCLLDNDSGMDNELIISAIESIMPALVKAGKIVKPSVSAGLIRKSTGETLPGGNNAHIYVLVKNAADIPRFGKVLHKRLILAGHGRVEFSKDGKILIRTLVDQFVHSPERLDFAARPVLLGDLEQRPPEIQYLPGDALDTSKLADLNEIEQIQYDKILRDLRKGAEKRALKIRKKYIDEEGKKVATAQNISTEAARQIIRNRTNNILSGDDVVVFDDGTSATWREILKDPSEYHGKTLPDPIEPEYGGGRNKAIFYANIDDGTPIIHSFAHGERIFRVLYCFDDLKGIIDQSGSDSLKNWPALIANGDLDDDEQENLLQLFKKKLGGSIKKMRSNLENTLSRIGRVKSAGPSYNTPEYAALNLEYGFVMMGNKAVIIQEYYDTGLKSWGFTAHRSSELKQYHDNQRVLRKDGKKDTNFFELWMQYPGRNTFDAMEFRPDPTIFRTGKRILQQRGIYNIWQGYTVKPIQGDCSLILCHIQNVWCSGDTMMYEYVLNWFADMFQHPARQGKTALVLQSTQGAGKNIIADGVIGRLLGCHALIATRKEDFLGRFNGLLGQAVFVFVNEAVWAGDREKQGALKGLITDDTLTIERKFLDGFKVPNYAHLLFASNESWVAPADIEDRRFVYPDVSNANQGDSAYFKRLADQINGGGRAAFLYEMLNRDLTSVDLTKLPENQSQQRLTDQLQTMPDHLKFFYDLLSNPNFESYLTSGVQTGYPLNNLMSWGKEWTPSKTDFHQMYLIFCHNIKHMHPSTKDVLMRQLFKSLPGMISTTKSTMGGARIPVLKFPPLSEAREKFAKQLKLAITWED